MKVNISNIKIDTIKIKINNSFYYLQKHKMYVFTFLFVANVVLKKANGLGGVYDNLAVLLEEAFKSGNPEEFLRLFFQNGGDICG